MKKIAYIRRTPRGFVLKPSVRAVAKQMKQQPTQIAMDYPAGRQATKKVLARARSARKKARKHLARPQSKRVNLFIHDFFPSVAAAHANAIRHGFTHTSWNGRIRACPPLKQYRCRMPNCKKMADERGGLCEAHMVGLAKREISKPRPGASPTFIVDEASSIDPSIYSPEAEAERIARLKKGR